MGSGVDRVSDQEAVITLREVYNKVVELTSTVTTHMSRQDTQHAVLEQRVSVVERDMDRHQREADKRHDDVQKLVQQEATEIRADLEAKKNRAWMGYASLIGAAAAIAAAVLSLVGKA